MKMKGVVMKRSTLAALISLCLVMPAFAVEGAPPPRPGPNFEQRKAEIIKNIDERLMRLQGMKACIQRAHTPEAAKACREKFEPRDRPENRKR